MHPKLASVLKKYPLPFTLKPYQSETVIDLEPCDRVGLYAEVGCGKTVMSTLIACIWSEQVPATKFVLMPPILLKSWYRWLCEVVGQDNVVMYRGTPKERASIDLPKYQWVLMSIQIFKNDFDYLSKTYSQKEVIGIVDEATSIKNISSANHRKVRDFFVGRKLMLLTGTPLSNPGDSYAYIKTVSPKIYRSKTQFENIHVEARDFFGNVTKWTRLDLMQKNLLVNSVRILQQDVLQHLKEPVYVPIRYELEKKHYALYKELAEEQLLELENGQRIDATSAPKLYNCLQQIIANYDHFSGEEDNTSAIFEIIENTLEEINGKSEDGRKLIIFANYKMTNRKLVTKLAQYGAVACYSDVSATQQEENVDRFCNDPSCRILIAQPLSAGYGLNLQHACSDILFVETPIVPRDFHQSVGRIAREGQKNVPVVRIAVAEGTCQEKLFRDLLNKDAVVNKVQRAYQDLKDAVYGK